jgi:hypothetical protein
MEGKEPRIRSALRLLPYLGMVLAWRLLYVGLGYGVAGSRLYIDPGQRPLLFPQALVERWPLLLAGQWTQAPVDLWILLTWSQRVVVWLVASAVLVGIGWLLWPLRRRPAARFWAAGMTLSILPLCAAFPMERLLVFAGVGAFALLALCAEACLLSSPARDRSRRGAAIVLLVLHGPIAAALLAGKTLGLPAFGEFFTAAARHAPVGPEIAGQTLVYVNGNDFPVVYSRVVRIATGVPAPRRVVQLASMRDRLRVERTDARTLVIAPDHGYLFYPVDRLFAGDDRSFDVGDRIERPDYRAEIVGVTRDGRAATVAFRFRRPLEDPSLRWLYWNDRRLQEFPLPPVGGSVTIPAVRLSPF